MENLLFGFNELSGEFPFWLDKLTKVKTINFSKNLFEGELPSFLGEFTALEGLALDRNMFTSTNDVFDASMHGGLRELKILFIENNQFTEDLDENFLKDSTKLEALDMSDNGIGGSVPSHFFEMPSLVILDLHDNDLQQLPQTFPENDKLAFLALHKCYFEDKEIPSSISNLRSLQHLDLSQNSFVGEIPSSIGTLKNLSYLFLAENDFIPGSIPLWIGNLTNLEELSLKSTALSGPVPNFIDSLQKLILLDLDNNNLTGAIPASIGSISYLQFLLLNRNNLSGAIPDSFSELSLLRKYIGTKYLGLPWVSCSVNNCRSLTFFLFSPRPALQRFCIWTITTILPEILKQPFAVIQT